MKNQLKRREFLLKGCIAGAATCAMLYGNKLYGMQAMLKSDEIPDPKKLEYCGYVCPENCKMKQATIANSPEAKKEAYDQFKLTDKGIVFDPDKIFCYGCKTDKPIPELLQICTVRKCVLDKGMECCIECDQLQACDKELWKKYPDFYQAVISMQKKYREQKVS
jgi:hypothetical protein